jgi:hypothetical protein
MAESQADFMALILRHGANPLLRVEPLDIQCVALADLQIDILSIDVVQDQGNLLSPFGSGSLELGFGAVLALNHANELEGCQGSHGRYLLSGMASPSIGQDLGHVILAVLQLQNQNSVIRITPSMEPVHVASSRG